MFALIAQQLRRGIVRLSTIIATIRLYINASVITNIKVWNGRCGTLLAWSPGVAPFPPLPASFHRAPGVSAPSGTAGLGGGPSAFSVRAARGGRAGPLPFIS